MHPVEMHFDVDPVVYFGQRLMGTLELFLPPKERVRIQDLRVTLRGEILFNLRQNAAYFGESLEPKIFFVKHIKLLDDEHLEHKTTYSFSFELDAKQLETYEGNFTNIHWHLEGSFDPISFFGGRQSKRHPITVRCLPSDVPTQPQPMVVPVKGKNANIVAKIDSIQCCLGKPLTGQFILQSFNMPLQRHVVVFLDNLWTAL